MTIWQFLTVLLGPVGAGMIGLIVFKYDRWERRRDQARSD
jgi:hypothetical protein